MQFCLGLAKIKVIGYSWMVVVNVSSCTATSEDIAHAVCGSMLAVARRWMISIIDWTCWAYMFIHVGHNIMCMYIIIAVNIDTDYTS